MRYWERKEKALGNIDLKPKKKLGPGRKTYIYIYIHRYIHIYNITHTHIHAHTYTQPWKKVRLAPVTMSNKKKTGPRSLRSPQ